MREGDASFDALRDAIDAFAIERAPQLVAEARAEAAARVRRMLVDAMADALLEQTTVQLPAPESPHTEPPARPARPAPPPRRPAERSERPRPQTPAAAVERPPEPRPAGSGLYVYGVADAGAELPLGLIGVDSAHRTEALVHGDLAALVSRVSLDEFAEDALKDNLNDVGWLEETARAHEHVLDAALAGTTVVPLRLCTIYSGEETVRAMLDDEREVLRDALERLAGHAEWGVKVVAAPGSLAAAASPAGGGSAEAESPGAAYLAGKRRDAEARDRADAIADEWVAAVQGPLLELARDARVNPPQNPELSGHEGEMLLNGVYLVSEDDAHEFRRVAAELRREFEDRGVTVDLTGPWPAYNFVHTGAIR